MSETRDVCNRCGGTGAFLAAPLPISGIRLWEPCPTCSEEGEISRLQSRIEELERALKPFADVADTWTVQNAAKRSALLTLSNGERMCAISANAFVEARSVLDAHKEGGK